MTKKSAKKSQSKLIFVLVFVFLSLVFLVLFLSRESNTYNPEKYVNETIFGRWIPFDNSRYDYSFEYPEGWYVVDRMEEEGRDRQALVVIENQNTGFKQLPDDTLPVPHLGINYFYAIGPMMLDGGPLENEKTFYVELEEGQTLAEYVREDMSRRSTGVQLEEYEIGGNKAVLATNDEEGWMILSIHLDDGRIFKMNVMTNSPDQDSINRSDYLNLLIETAERVNFQ